MKKIFSLILILTVLLLLFSCNNTVTNPENNETAHSCSHDSCKENGPFNCIGENNTCQNKTDCAYDFFCSTCITKLSAKPTLEKVYVDVCTPEAFDAKWITLMSLKTGTTLLLDTNPYGTANPILYIADVEIAFLTLCKEFNIPSTVWDKIENTAPVDGVQTYKNGDLLIFWSFTYSHGLSITISQN